MEGYKKAWSLFRLHNVAGIVLVVSFIPVLLLLAHFHAAMIVIVSMGIGMAVGILYSALWIGYFHCPRCGEQFYPSRRFANISVFRSHCQGCGLRLYEHT
jgi:hypothetical protein